MNRDRDGYTDRHGKEDKDREGNSDRNRERCRGENRDINADKDNN